MAEIYKIGSDEIVDRVSEFGGTNLVVGTSNQWSSWYTPAVNGTNQTSAPNHIGYFPADVKSGDIFVISLDIEFSGVTVGSGGTFSWALQGNAEKNGAWTWSNTWNPWTRPSDISVNIALTDGVYHLTRVSTANANVVGETCFRCGFRADYWGSGKWRWRNVKVEKGNKPTDWTPAPQDLVIISSTELQLF